MTGMRDHVVEQIAQFAGWNLVKRDNKAKVSDIDSFFDTDVAMYEIVKLQILVFQNLVEARIRVWYCSGTVGIRKTKSDNEQYIKNVLDVKELKNIFQNPNKVETVNEVFHLPARNPLQPIESSTSSMNSKCGLDKNTICELASQHGFIMEEKKQMLQMKLDKMTKKITVNIYQNSTVTVQRSGIKKQVCI